METSYRARRRAALFAPAAAVLGALVWLAAGAGAVPDHSVSRSRAVPQPPRLDYLHDIRPILSANCFTCHGQDEKKRQAGLRLDTPEGAYGRTADGLRAIVPGDPARSGLWARISASAAIAMPPAGSGKRLTAGEVQILRRWIREGAHYQPHWAFQPVRRPVPPAVANTRWPLGPIDRCVLARLEKEGLSPSLPADRHTLLRRVSLDLTGLPPTPAEERAFAADHTPGAYERAVDRLLASPHFGEKWARKWLDLARYADSAGYGSDPLRPNLWPYRDWLINAFNSNLPYDRFVLEQLAGDLLPSPTPEQLIATSFHRNTMTNTEGGTDREEFRTAAVKDRAVTTAQAFTGLTLGCAQCHSHKYDPITNREFYRFMAFFNQTEDNDQPDERPTMALVPELERANIEALTKQIEELQKVSPQTPSTKLAIEVKRSALAALQTVKVPIMRELPAEKRRKSHMLTLGNFLLPTEEVDPGVPASLPPLPAGAPPTRLGLAEWIINRSNPLTARVEVNRIWAQLFGAGIVETEEDFGQQGALPSHPEMLDWLAMEFMDRNWDRKAIIREIVLSATYRQSSQVRAVPMERDARCRLLWRYPRRRLDAETVRDQALALSGLLSEKIGGPSVFPPQPAGLWQAAFNGERTYPTSIGEDRYRRGIYTFWRRTSPNPSMTTFDAPSREICTLRRFPTNTPLQALVTLNDPAYVEMAQALGRRIVREGGPTLESRARWALELVLGRPPAAAEVQPLLELVQRSRARYQADPAAALRLATDPLGPLTPGSDPAEMAAWTVAGNVLLNLDGVMTNR